MNGNTPIHCCNQPPRMFSGAGFGHAFMCTQCGKGLFSNFLGHTYQSAVELWNSKSIHIGPPVRTDSVAAVAMRVLDEMNDAQDVLRSLAYTLGTGGYNATDVDAKVFEAKIRDGIDMLTKPLTDRIEVLQKKKDLPESMTVVAEMEFEGCRYEIRKNGYVDVTILETGRGFTRHINNITLSVQKALEEHLKKEG